MQGEPFVGAVKVSSQQLVPAWEEHCHGTPVSFGEVKIVGAALQHYNAQLRKKSEKAVLAALRRGMADAINDARRSIETAGRTPC